MNTKELINLLKNVHSRYHYDIFIILKKYDIKYTRNNNGIFFDVDQIDQSILDELYNYMSALNSNTDTDSTHQSEYMSHLISTDLVKDNTSEENKHVNENNEREEKVNKVTSKSLNEECENIVKNVMNDDTLKVSKILHDIEKEKNYINKKTAINKFSVAKKKYAKQVITATENHDLSNILDFD